MSSGKEFLRQNVRELESTLTFLVKKAGTIVEAMLTLAYLYAGSIVIQVIVLPLLVFWFCIKFINNLFSRQLPATFSIHHPSGSDSKPEKSR